MLSSVHRLPTSYENMYPSKDIKIPHLSYELPSTSPKDCDQLGPDVILKRRQVKELEELYVLRKKVFGTFLCPESRRYH